MASRRPSHQNQSEISAPTSGGFTRTLPSSYANPIANPIQKQADGFAPIDVTNSCRNFPDSAYYSVEFSAAASAALTYYEITKEMYQARKYFFIRRFDDGDAQEICINNAMQQDFLYYWDKDTQPFIKLDSLLLLGTLTRPPILLDKNVEITQTEFEN